MNATQLHVEEIKRVATKRLANHEMSLTGPRLGVLRQLNQQVEPVTIADLAGLFKLPKPHRVTLYRTMEALGKAGLVTRVRFPGEDQERFELGEAFRPHHHHLVCESCGAVADVQAEPTRPKLPRGFKLFGHQLEFYGLCAGCAKGAA